MTPQQAQLWAHRDEVETHTPNAEGPWTFPLLGFQRVQSQTQMVQVKTGHSSLGTLSSQGKMMNKMAQQDHPGLMPGAAGSTYSNKATQQLSTHSYLETDG